MASWLSLLGNAVDFGGGVSVRVLVCPPFLQGLHAFLAMKRRTRPRAWVPRFCLHSEP